MQKNAGLCTSVDTLILHHILKQIVSFVELMEFLPCYSIGSNPALESQWQWLCDGWLPTSWPKEDYFCWRCPQASSSWYVLFFYLRPCVQVFVFNVWSLFYNILSLSDCIQVSFDCPSALVFRVTGFPRQMIEQMLTLTEKMERSDLFMHSLVDACFTWSTLLQSQGCMCNRVTDLYMVTDTAKD